MIVFILLLSYLSLCAIVFTYQRSLIYHPTPLAPVEPDSLISLTVDGVELKISAREREGENAVLYFGGNAEIVSQSLPKFTAAFPNQAIYMPHYRGYSGSAGNPSEAALNKDAGKVYEWVKAKHPNIILIGRSLGSGVAVRLAAERKINRLILITPFDSLLSLAKKRFPQLPVSLMLQDKFESWRYAPRINVPTLILAAELDSTVPKESSETLFQAFKPGVAEFKMIKNTDHVSISRHPDYFPWMQIN